MKFSFTLKNKKLLSILALLYLVGLSLVSSMKTKLKQRENPKEGCVIIYKDCNYEGPKVEICEDQPDFRILNFSDQASAISLSKNVKVMMFELKDFKGNSKEVTKDESCFSYTKGLTEFNDKVNSLKIISIPPERPGQGCVRIFEKCNYKGKSYSFCNDRPLFSKKYFNSETVSSFWLGENTEIQLFMEVGLKGQSKSFSQDFDCLGTCMGWNSDKAKSASVYTVVRTQKKFTEEEMKKLEDEEAKEEERKKKESNPDYFSVIYATYGDLDITDKISSLVNQENHTLTFSAFTDSFGSTMQGIYKTSHIFYWANSQICVAGIKDNEVLDLSVEKGGNCYAFGYTKRNFKVYAASYGGKDVTGLIRAFAEKSEDLVTIEVGTQFIGEDPLPGWTKTFSIFYEIDNIRVRTTLIDGQKLNIKSKSRELQDAEKAKKEAEEELRKKKEEEKKAKEEAEKRAKEEKERQEREAEKKKEEDKKKFSVIDAQYGPNFVSDDLKSRIIDKSLIFKIYSNFPTLPEDYLKMSTIFYWSNSKICYRTVRGDESVVISGSPSGDEAIYCHEAPSAQDNIKVYIATFGGSDVTNIIREKAKDSKFSSIRATSLEFGKPLPGWQNSLFIHYSIGNSFITKIMLENEKIVFSNEIEKQKEEEENKKKVLEKALEEAKKEQENKKYIFSIAGASYGPTVTTDYTSSLVKDDKLSISPTNEVFGDTWVSIKKTLHLFYWFNNKICVITELENSNKIEISKDSSGTRGSCHSKPEGTESTQIQIYAASYGTTDVTEQMRKMYDGKSKSQLTYFIPDLKDFQLENVKDGLVKRTFSILFKINNTLLFAVVVEGFTLDFLKIYENDQKDKDKGKQIVQKAEIIIANYGLLRVTDRVRRIVEVSTTPKITIQASNTVFGDPSPTHLKTASVLYKINGKYCITSAQQNDDLVIEENDAQCYTFPSDNGAKIKVLAASYAGKDVTEILRKKFAKTGLDKLVINDSNILKTGLDSKWLKVLVIQYELNSQIFTFLLSEDYELDFISKEQERKVKEIEEGTYFKVSHASYGPLEVTDKVRLLVDNDKYLLKFKPENKLFGDTWVGNSPKYSHIFYLMHNRICVANSVEYGQIDVGIDKAGVCYEEPANTKSGVKIEAASWGDRDVTEYLRKKSFDANFRVVFAEDSYFGDSLKTLSIQFVVNGKRFNRIIKEHEVMDLIDIEAQDEVLKHQSIRAEEELKKKIDSMQLAIKAKQELIMRADITEKEKLALQRQIEEENSRINEEKTALIAKEKDNTLKKMDENYQKNLDVTKKHYVERTYLTSLTLKTEPGTLVESGKIITITNIATGSKLYTTISRKNGKGELEVAGYPNSDNESNVYWQITSDSKKLENLNTIKLMHRETKTYLYSKKGQISPVSGHQEVLTALLGNDQLSDWKIVIVSSYGNETAFKVGDVFKMKSVNSDLFLTTSKNKELKSENNMVYADSSDDLYVVTEVK